MTTTDMQAATEAQIVAAARALANHNADTCNVNREDNWMIYGDSFRESAEIALKAALASRSDSQADAQGEIPADCDVRKILLRVVPGDGDGFEVYAKNVGDVEQFLSEMGERLENFELARAAAPQAEAAQGVPEEVREAVERMCSPLHESRLSGVTAQEDARCMKLIRDYVLGNSAPMLSGWKRVPIEPTDAMVQAAFHLDLSYMPGQEGADRAAIYRAMLATAPSPDREQVPYGAPFTTDVPQCCGEPETCNDPCADREQVGEGYPRPATSHCQNGGDVCLAGNRDGVCCPEDSCDIDDGVRKAPKSADEIDSYYEPRIAKTPLPKSASPSRERGERQGAAQLPNDAVIRLKALCKTLGLETTIPDHVYADPEGSFVVFGMMRSKINTLAASAPTSETLASNQCVHAKGIIGDEGGTPCCPVTMTSDATPCKHDWKLSETHRDGNAPWVCSRCGIWEASISAPPPPAVAQPLTDDQLSRVWMRVNGSTPNGMMWEHARRFARALLAKG